MRRSRLRAAAPLLAAGAALAFAAPATPASAAAPAVCPAGQTANTVHYESFDSAGFGWKVRNLAGSGDLPGGPGQLQGSHWHYPPPALGLLPWSAPLNIWADTRPGGATGPTKAESAIEMGADVSLPAEARMLFVHRFDFGGAGESRGIVEQSLDHGETWHALGAFSGAVKEHRSTWFDLAGAPGREVRVRFRIQTGLQTAAGGAPSGDAGEFRGWAIDDVHFYTCAEQPTSVAPPSAPPPLKAGVERRAQQPLSIAVLRRPSILKRGIRQRLRILLANGSDTPIRGLRVCFQAPVKVIRGRRCTTIRRLPSESSAVVDFPIVLRELVPARRTRVAIRFVARGAGGILADAQRGYRLAPVSSQSASPSM